MKATPTLLLLAALPAWAETVPVPPRADILGFMRPAGYASLVGMDLNNLGQAIGTASNGNGTERAVVWHADGSLHRQTAGQGLARFLNDQGLAVVLGSGSVQVWRPDGSQQAVGSGLVRSLNNLGEVAGDDAVTTSGACGGSWRWSATLGLRCESGALYAVGDSGHALKNVSGVVSIVDPQGRATPLALAPGQAPLPLALSADARYAMASMSGPQGSFSALRWDRNVLTVLPSLGGNFASPVAMNDAGAIVGSARNAAGAMRPVLWDADGRITDMGTWFSGSVSAVAINNRAELLVNTASDVLRVTLHPDWQGGSGAWDDARRWNWGGAGVVATAVSDVHDAVINPGIAVNVTGGADARARSLWVGGNAAAPVAFDLAGGRTTTEREMIFAAGSELRGHGILATGEGGFVHIDTGARVRVGGGERLVVAAPSWSIAGQVRVLGTPLQAAQVQSGPFTSIARGGQLHLSQADAVFLGSNAEQLAVVNDGQVTVQESFVSAGGAGFKNGSGAQLLFSFGRSSVEGRLFNEAGATAVVSNGALASFFGVVHNDGEFRISNGGAVNFFGLVSGGGFFSGDGQVRFEGGLSVGQSPGLVTVAPDIAIGIASPVLMELGGTTAGFGNGHHDKIVFDGSVVLEGGALDVAWWAGFSGAAGDRFDLFDWNGGLAGRFGSVALPTLAGGLVWDASDLYAGGTLAIAAVPEPGTWALFGAGLALFGLRRRYL